MKKLTLILIVFLLIGCQKQDDSKVIIAEQYGLAYAPIQVMKARGTLEALVDEEVKWVKLANTAAIREALLANRLDIGFLGIPPFILGYDNAVDWKIFSGLCEAPLGLMSNKVLTLESIQSSDRIALPQPGSIQHILLAMAAERTFGEADYFDKQLITMKHPDGMQALYSDNEVTLHFTSPPYIFEEAAAGMHQVIDSETCMGEAFTFIVGVTTPEFYEKTDLYDAFNQALEETLIFIKENPEETIALLMPYYQYDQETLSTYVYESGMSYTSDIKGVQTFIDFMYRNDYIKKTYEAKELIW